MCPHKTRKRERIAHINNQATSGTQNAGKPKAHEGGQWGVQGRSPHDRGLWGCPPTKPKEGASRPH